MSKYIDAEKLIMEIKFAKSVYDNPKRVVHGVADAYRQDGRATMCDDILKVIESLQQEQPEPFSCSHENGYDEAYLQEKIAKASKTWKGVDVDKFMDEVRGREQEQPEVDLEKEIDRKVIECTNGYDFDWDKFARHFYKLGKNEK